MKRQTSLALNSRFQQTWSSRFHRIPNSGVRSLCSASGLVDECDLEIGQLLSKAPADDDGAWPPVAVCQVLEKIGSDAIADGLITGLFNQRGEYSLAGGSAQQMETAQRYWVNADRILYDFPYVAAVLRAYAARCEERSEEIKAELELMRWLGN